MPKSCNHGLETSRAMISRGNIDDSLSSISSICMTCASFSYQEDCTRTVLRPFSNDSSLNDITPFKLPDIGSAGNQFLKSERRSLGQSYGCFH